MIKTYEVIGMSCVMCKNSVEKTLNSLSGVNNARVNLLENEVSVDFDETRISEAELKKAVDASGYKLIIDKRNDLDLSLIKLVISIILVLLIMTLSMGKMIGINLISNTYINGIVQAILNLIVIILNIKFYKSGLYAFKYLNPNMDSLVMLSSGVSFVYSLIILLLKLDGYHFYFETSAMILVIVSIGKRIEGSSKKKTTKIIRGLSTLIPMETTILVDGIEKVIPIEELKKNDIVRLRPGDSVPQDGIIIKGITSVDESMINGESLLVKKEINDEVIGGTINIDGVIEIKITKNANQTVLANIINLTKSSAMSKIRIERLADTISKYFVIAVLLISLLTLIIWLFISKDIEVSLNFALSVLVISCPCALGLATPSAIVVASGVAAKSGILIKNPEILEIMGKVKTCIFDKTGTLTQNKLTIVDIKEYDKEFINVLSSIEKGSKHPIANAINSKYKNGNIIFDDITQVSGQGLIAHLNNNEYLAGNIDLLLSHNILINQNDFDYAINNNYSLIAVSKNSELLGIVYLSDVLRQSSFKAIKELKERDITPYMCTGDNDIAASKAASILNIKDYMANVKPEDKNILVKEKQNEGYVAMIGDGINDAIAMSSADVSFTVSSGSDIAHATSDIILLNNDLRDISFIYDVSKKTMRIIKQNLFWALFYNALFIPLAAGVFYLPFNLKLNPMIGALTMSLSSIIVIGNALRINSLKKEETKYMNKEVYIEGMMCEHCAKRVEDALSGIGANVTVVLNEKKAILKDTNLDDETIKNTIEDAGYEVKDIKVL